MISNDVEVMGGMRAVVVQVSLHGGQHVVHVWPPGEITEGTERYAEIKLVIGELLKNGKVQPAACWRSSPESRQLDMASMNKIIERINDILEEARSHVRELETKNGQVERRGEDGNGAS